MLNFTEQNIFIFLLQLFILLGLARGLGEIFQRWKQPALTAEILVGVLLGPTILGRFLPGLHQFIFPPDLIQQSMLETLAWLGLFFFLLETGLKIDFTAAWKHKGNALKIAVSDIIIPMAMGVCLVLLLPSRYFLNSDNKLIFALFMATVMTISAMPTTVRALSDLDMVKTDLGYLIMSALSVNEIIGWVIFTVILGLFMNISVNIGHTIILLPVVVAITILSLTTGRKFSDFVISKIKASHFPEPGASLTFLCLAGFLYGAIFQKIGVHALLGFFVAGIMVGEAKGLPEKTRQVISQMVYAIFVPLFFVGIGLKVDFFKNFDPFLVLFVTFIGIFGKFIGAWIGAKFTKLSPANRLFVAIAHTPGGSMEIVIGMLALQYNLISQSTFVAIVFGGVFSAAILGPWLRYSVSRRKEISILEFFGRDQIIAEVASLTRENAISELCMLASGEQRMPHFDALYSAVLNRERMMGTAIEQSIAFPHARLNSLQKPVVIFGRSYAGIDWDSPDGKLTHFIFLLLTPKADDDIQVKVLRAVSKAMLDERICASIASAQDEDDIWRVFSQVFATYSIIRERSS